VLEPLGADVSGSQFLEPDGTFPNHIPNPENKAAMEAAVHAVKSTGATGCQIGTASIQKNLHMLPNPCAAKAGVAAALCHCMQLLIVPTLLAHCACNLSKFWMNT
jgi:hypothetical protein